MSKIGFQRNAYWLDFKLKIDFYFQSSHIYSVNQRIYDKMFPKENGPSILMDKKQISEFGYLIIDSTYDLHSYDSLNEGSANIRPNIIVINGILSFITNQPFIPAMSFRSGLYTVERHIIKTGSKPVAICEEDLSKELDKLLVRIERAKANERILFFTILERWRKALYLEKESEESDIFVDESVLAYMHVLEVLADEFKGELNENIRKKRKEASEGILKMAQDLKSKPKDIVKLINNLESIRISLKEKIFQLLVSFDLDCLKTRIIVERFIEHRNAIAHGRKNLFQEKLLFPLPQFFSFIKDVDEDIEVIKVLAARCISKLFDLSLWHEEWEWKLRCEILPFKLVEEFLNSKEFTKYESCDYFEGEEDNISPDTLAFYYKKGKVDFFEMEAVLGKAITSCKKQKIKYQKLFEAAVILSDSTKDKLSTKCKKIVSAVYQNRWYFRSNIRDVIKDYEYHGKKLGWFEEWLKSGKETL